MKRSIPLLMIVVSLALLAGCQQPVAGKQGGTREVSLRFALPPSPSEGSGLARILDPSSQRIEVTVSGAGIADPIVRSFTRHDSTAQEAFDPAIEYWMEMNSSSLSESFLDRSANLKLEIPIGLDRHFAVKSFDAQGLICAGESVETVDLYRTWYDVRLLPVVYTDIKVNQTVTSTVPAGRAVYYRFLGTTETANQWLLFNVKAAGDVDLFVSSPDYWNWYYSWYQAAQVDEGVLVNTYGFDYQGQVKEWYAAVYNPTASDQAYSLQAKPLVDKPFDLYSSVNYLDSSPYQDVAGTIGATELFAPGHFDGTGNWSEIPLGFTFNYNGTPYTKLYVSPNGYVSFWKTSFFYDWWYWAVQDWWSNYPWYNYNYNNYTGNYYLNHHWGLGEGTTLPNELVSLWRRPAFLLPSQAFVDAGLAADLAAADAFRTRISFKKGTYTVNGLTSPSIEIEFRNLYAWFDTANPDATRKITGKIVLAADPYSPTSNNGIIELRYDRANSVGVDVQAFVGLENNVGRQFNLRYQNPENNGPYIYGPNGLGGVSGLPPFDLQLTSRTGGVIISAE